MIAPAGQIVQIGTEQLAGAKTTRWPAVIIADGHITNALARNLIADADITRGLIINTRNASANSITT